MVENQPPEPDVGDLIGPADDGNAGRSPRQRAKEMQEQAFREVSGFSGHADKALLLIHNGHPDDEYDLRHQLRHLTERGAKFEGREVKLFPVKSLEEALAVHPSPVESNFKFVVVSCGDVSLSGDEYRAYRDYCDRLIWIVDAMQPSPPSGLRFDRPIEGSHNQQLFDKIFEEIEEDGEGYSESKDDRHAELSADSILESSPSSATGLADVSEEELKRLVLPHGVEYAPTDLQPDGLAAIRVLLEARMNGELLVDALRRWVLDDSAFLGWAELNSSDDQLDLTVGGRDRGAVLRSLGDPLDEEQPLPTGVGQFGRLIGLPHDGSWLGFLARDPDAGRRELFKVLQMLPLLERLSPPPQESESPQVEDPENRFSRLLATRLRAVERGGPAPGVLLLEHAVDSNRLVDKDLLRGTDWIESSQSGLWVLLDHPALGAAEALTRRLEEALPGIRGGGVIGVSAGEVAQECMERCKELLRNSDHLRIVDQMR